MECGGKPERDAALDVTSEKLIQSAVAFHPGVWRLCEIQKRTCKLARIERPLLGLERLLIKILT